jgi:hypothetical protein
VATCALDQNQLGFLLAEHSARSPGIRKEPKKQKPPKNQAAVMACGDFVFLATSSPLFRTQAP